MMEGWIIAATLITAIAGLIAASSAVWLGWLNRQLVVQNQMLVKASQDQVAVSQEEVRASQAQVQQSVETQQDAQLPILIPIERVISTGYAQDIGASQPVKNGYDPEWPFVRIVLENVGSGIALNAYGVVFMAEPKQGELAQPGYHIHRYTAPLKSGSSIGVDWKDKGTAISGDTEIGATERYKLYAPSLPTAVETGHGQTVKIARLTLTYRDIFGRKHAAIFDLTKDMEWENVAYLRNITEGLGDLRRAALSRMPVYSAPPIPIAK